MSLGIPTRCSLPVFSPLSIASVFGKSVLLLLVFNETSVLAILDCRATLGFGAVTLPGRSDGGLCLSLHEKTEETRAPEGQSQLTPQQAFFSFRKNTEEKE